MNESNLFIYEDVYSKIRIYCSNLIVKLNVSIKDLIKPMMSLINLSLSLIDLSLNFIAYSRFASIYLLWNNLPVMCSLFFVVECCLFEITYILNPNFKY